jgi:hypothetical protein
LRQRTERVYADLERRLIEEPGVRGVTFANRLPRMGDATINLEFDGDSPRAPEQQAGFRVKSGLVDVDYFDVLGAKVVAGRGFQPADIGADQRVLLVNKSFVDRVMAGHNPVGRRVRSSDLRLPGEPESAEGVGEWFEIIGVVETLAMSATDGLADRGVYQPIGPGSADPLNIAIHLDGEAGAFAPRLRSLVTEVDPSLQADGVQPMSEIESLDLRYMSLGSQVLAVFSVIAVVLSLAGIYSIVSLAVSRRTREIGVRVALGAPPARVLRSVFRKPLAQVGGGILTGAGLLVIIPVIGGGWDGELPSIEQIAWFAAYLALLTAVCALACVVPSRRALRIEPVDAMRTDG